MIYQTFDDLSKKEQDAVLSSMTILVDTREHEGKNDHILSYFDKREIPWKRQKLDQGDYSCMIPANEGLGISEDLYFDREVMIERKANLNEISGNLTKKRSRFEKELRNAPERKIILIENSTYGDLVSGSYDTEFSPKAFWASLFSMWHRYNAPVIFLKERKYTGQYIYGFLYYFVYNRLRGKV